jgi:hypothetical protein
LAGESQQQHSNRSQGGVRGQLTPKTNEPAKEPVSLSFNKTAFSLKNEECIRESLAKNLPASLVAAKYKQKDIITGLITLLNNYFEV